MPPWAGRRWVSIWAAGPRTRGPGRGPGSAGSRPRRVVADKRRGGDRFLRAWRLRGRAGGEGGRFPALRAARLARCRTSGDWWHPGDPGSYGTRLGIIAGFSYPGRAERSRGCWTSMGVASSPSQGPGRSVRRTRPPRHARGGGRAQTGCAECGRCRRAHVPGCVCAVGSRSSGVAIAFRMDNWYRAYRRLDDIVKALSERGMELPWERTRTPRTQPVNPAPMVGEFTAWYAGRRGQAPDAEIVEEVAGEWLDCVVPGTERLITAPGQRSSAL